MIDIKKFSAENNAEYFTNFFDKGLLYLEAKDIPEEFTAGNLFPQNYLSLDAVQLLAACDASWVFGGAGSWNDMAFDAKQKKEYEQVSAKLFQELCASIVCAVNTTIK